MQNPFRHLNARHLCCEEFNQINLDGFFVRVFTNLEIPCVVSFILGGSVDDQGSVWLVWQCIRLCTVTSWSCGREKLFTRMGGMRRKPSTIYENTNKNPSWELSDADGS